jgi:NADH dehydrogenase
MVVDRTNHHLFQPLLPPAASAVLSPPDIADPTRRGLRYPPNARPTLAEATAIHLEPRRVTVAGCPLDYDWPVLDAVATHANIRRDDWATRTPRPKTVDDGVEIRRRVLFAFEAAEPEADSEPQRAHLTFVIAGGGPSEVELAGAPQEIATETPRADLRRVDAGAAPRVLVEGQSRLLPNMSDVAARLPRDPGRTSAPRVGLDWTRQMM